MAQRNHRNEASRPSIYQTVPTAFFPASRLA